MLSIFADLHLCGLLLSLFAVTACAPAQPASGDRPGAPSTVLTSLREMPVLLCIPVKEEDWAALRSGSTRLILHFQNQTRSYVYSPSFQVSLVGPEESQRVAVDQLAMNPDIQSAAGDLPDPQHFGINLRTHLPAAIDRSTLCVEVDVEPAGRTTPNRLRIWATLEPLPGH